MNVKRFSARTSRDALNLVRQTFGEDAVVLSTRPCADGVEVLAMAADGVPPIERAPDAVPAAGAAPAAPAKHAAPAKPAAAAAPGAAQPAAAAADSVEHDVAQLSMSTLSFQDYVRERMLRRRRAEQQQQQQAQAAAALAEAQAAERHTRAQPPAAGLLRLRAQSGRDEPARPHAPVLRDSVADAAPAPAAAIAPAAASRERAERVERVERALPAASAEPSDAAERSDRGELLHELRAMKGLIEDRFGALAFMEKLQRQPRQALLTQKLLDQGFSPALIRRLADSLPDDVDEAAWSASVLERNLASGEAEAALEDSGGVYALIGATGVGKTTSTAKLAAAFATRHGAANLGLITLDAYRMAAHEQLRAYGRILGVPVHTAHDRASLDDLLDLLAAKKMVLIDTAGMAQRDSRTRELLDMLSHRSVNRLLVVNAAAQGETIDDVLQAYRANTCRAVILSKVDEAVKLAPALDAMIRHRLKVLAVANGQRVPEDWHRLSAAALVQQ
ncbi:MAG TPA: flagellar biosynthesis protein FlhF, partial [Rubrivivax sp.]|nr:flagellar biosynthesis protein FlhF [Rubrivivax sp.]